MTGEDSTRQQPEESYYIPPVTPVAKDPRTAEKKTKNDWLGLAYIIIGIFVLIAAFQLYFIIQELIRTWFSDQYVPVVSAVYYVAVIILGVWLIRDSIRKQ